jgi:hypothetical protein
MLRHISFGIHLLTVQCIEQQVDILLGFVVSSALYKDEKLYEGSRIQQLVACGLRLEACCLKLETIYKKFQSL